MITNNNEHDSWKVDFYDFCIAVSKNKFIYIHVKNMSTSLN